MFKKLFQKKNNTSPAENYLNHLDRIFQKEAEFYKEDSLIPETVGVSSIVYKDIPEEGMLTAFTYGLSAVKHPDWKAGRAELMIAVESQDKSWAVAIAQLANKLRGDCPFSYSNTINFGRRISEESEMDAFLIFAPSIFQNQDDYLHLDIGLDFNISIAAAYPIYSSEIEFIEREGLEKFWKHPDFDLYNVRRKRIL